MATVLHGPQELQLHLTSLLIRPLRLHIYTFFLLKISLYNLTWNSFFFSFMLRIIYSIILLWNSGAKQRISFSTLNEVTGLIEFLETFYFQPRYALLMQADRISLNSYHTKIKMGF